MGPSNLQILAIGRYILNSILFSKWDTLDLKNFPVVKIPPDPPIGIFTEQYWQDG